MFLAPPISRHKERDRHMKLTVENVAMVNWDVVKDTLETDCRAAVAGVIEQAKEALADLEPGTRKTIPIKVGSVTIARPK